MLEEENISLEEVYRIFSHRINDHLISVYVINTIVEKSVCAKLIDLKVFNCGEVGVIDRFMAVETYLDMIGSFRTVSQVDEGFNVVKS